MATETPNVGNVTGTKPAPLAAAVQTGGGDPNSAPLGSAPVATTSGVNASATSTQASSASPPAPGSYLSATITAPQNAAPSTDTTFATSQAGNSLQTLLPPPSGAGFGPSAAPAAGGGFFQSVFQNQS